MRSPSPALTFLATVSLGGCDLNQKWHPLPVELYTPVFAAAGRGDVATVRQALDEHPQLVRAREADDLTLLLEAVAEGQIDMARLLISRHARVNARTGGGLTALHLAAQNGDVPMMELLRRDGAKVNAVDHHGTTPLDQARRHDHGDAVDWLLRNGAHDGQGS